jgi:hypothetical protein
MADQNIKLIIEAVTKGFDKLQTLLNPLNDGLTKTKEQIKNTDSEFKSAFQKTETSSSFSDLTSSLGSLLVSIGAAAAAYKTFHALISIPIKGLGFNKEMETARIGIASVLTATTEIISEDGRRLSGMQKLNEAQKIATDLMKQLQIAGLETTATTQELVAGFQTFIGPATAAGLSLKQTKDFTVMMVQALGAMGIEMNQLSAEGRSLLDGSIVPTQDRLATALGITGEMVAQWKASGTYWQEITKRLEAFKLSGQAVAQTWSGLASNMKDAISFIGGEMTKGLFDNIKTAWKSLLDVMINTKGGDIGIGSNIKNILEGAKAIADDIGKLLVSGVKGFIDILKDANTFIGQNKGQFIVMYEEIKKIITEYGKILAIIPQITAETIKWGVESSTVSGALKVVSTTFAAMKDLRNTVILAFQDIGVAIINLIMKPVSGLFGLIGKGFQAMGVNTMGNALTAVADQLNGSIAAANKGLADNAKLYWEQGSAVKNVLTETVKVTAETQKHGDAAGKSTAKVTAMSTSYALLKNQLEANNKLLDEGLKILDEQNKTRKYDVEVKYTGTEGGEKRDKAMYDKLLALRQVYYNELIQLANNYVTKQNPVFDRELENVNRVAEAQLATIAKLEKARDAASDPKLKASYSEQIAAEQKLYAETAIQQAKILALKVETAQKAQSVIAKALDESIQAERKYADEVKRLNDEIKAAAYSDANLLRDLKRTQMSESDVLRDKEAQAEQTLALAKAEIEKGNYETAKKYAKDSQSLYAEMAKSGKDFSENYAGAEAAGKVYIEILQKQKAEAVSRWQTEQKNIEDLAEAMKKVESTVKTLSDLLNALTKDAKANIIFNAVGLSEIEQKIKAMDGTVINVTVKQTTVQEKNAGGIVTGYASGGQVPGGYGTRDTVDAKLTPGEFVIPAGVVRALTPAFFYDLINMKIDASRLKDMFTNISRPNISIPKIPHYNAGGLVADSGGMGSAGPRETIDLNLNFGGTTVPVMMEKKNIPLIRQLAAEQKRNQKVRG